MGRAECLATDGGWLMVRFAGSMVSYAATEPGRGMGSS